MDMRRAPSWARPRPRSGGATCVPADEMPVHDGHPPALRQRRLRGGAASGRSGAIGYDGFARASSSGARRGPAARARHLLLRGVHRHRTRRSSRAAGMVGIAGFDGAQVALDADGGATCGRRCRHRPGHRHDVRPDSSPTKLGLTPEDVRDRAGGHRGRQPAAGTGTFASRSAVSGGRRAAPGRRRGRAAHARATPRTARESPARPASSPTAQRRACAARRLASRRDRRARRAGPNPAATASRRRLRSAGARLSRTRRTSASSRSSRARASVRDPALRDRRGLRRQ